MSIINNSQGDNIKDLSQYLEREEKISSGDFQKILQTSSEIFHRCLPLGQSGSVKGLIYGRVQSGKTAVILTTMALAADNGYNKFIVMTSDNNSIYDQTLGRIKEALDSFQVFGKREFDNNTAPNNSNTLPLVLVSSKNPKRLKKVSDIIYQLNWENESVIIIDDEADQASLDTTVNNPNKPASPVNQEIVNLRSTLSYHSYLQTTATPQALLLQDNQSAFRPDFVIVTKPGTGYVGGNYLFGDDNFLSSDHVRVVPDIDVDRLKTSKKIPDTVENSLLVFFLGAAILRIQGSKSKRYTYLLHTSLKKGDHNLAFGLVNGFKNDLTNELTQNQSSPLTAISSKWLSKLQNAYKDLQGTFKKIPPFPDVIKEAARRITSTEVIEINSRTGEGVSPDLTRKHTLYIGGTKIGRGVTVKNLLVTYYGRDAQQPQMDTVLQHARMYGYRQNELPGIRVYLPLHLAKRFHQIHVSDNLVREQCEATHEAIKSIPLIEPGIRPTRRNVLNENTVVLVTYQGGRQYFPSIPVSDPNILGTQTQDLDRLLSDNKYPNLKEPYLVTIDKILEILKFQFAADKAGTTWKDDLIRKAVTALRKYEKYNNTGYLVIVNRESDIKKAPSRNYTQISSVFTGRVVNPPYGVRRDYPALLMIRLTGAVDSQGGWDGKPFWIPVVRFPDGNYAFSVNYS